MAAMKTAELNFSYPETLIAVEPRRPSRVMFSTPKHGSQEITIDQLMQQFAPGDVVVINDTKVVKKRLFTKSGLEVLFLDEVSPNIWTVLLPAKKMKVGEEILLPGGQAATLVEKGLPQKLQVSDGLGLEYFQQFGRMALPPYIQKARGEREGTTEDEVWYQTQWANPPGSSAAPTASLHFSNRDWEVLKSQGVFVETLTLHVGLGTFLPVHSKNLTDHKMHSEWVEIPKSTMQAIQLCKKQGGRVWALGTTVTRALESQPLGYFKESENSFFGETDIFIYPGFQFQLVDVLMTNFHQPKSTLLALVCAFAGTDRTLQAYQWAVENHFRLFSYGDLSVWTK